MKIIRNFISWNEKENFKGFLIPSLREALKRKPKGDLIILDMSTVSIGNLPWKNEHWKKIFEPGKDPMFKPSLPWDNSYDPKNIQQTSIGISISSDKLTRGCIYSNWSIKYGVVQVLAKFPFVEGAWSAIWLFGGLPEFDFEHCGCWDHQVTATQHWGYDYGEHYGKRQTQYNERRNECFSPTEQFYLYEIELTPYDTIWRINGLPVRHTKKGANSSDQHLIVSTGFGNYCKGSLKEEAILQVKQIRIYKR